MKNLLLLIIFNTTALIAQTNCHCSDPNSIHNDYMLIHDDDKIILHPNAWVNKTDNYFPDYSQGTELIFEDNFDGTDLDANKWYSPEGPELNDGNVIFKKTNCFANNGFFHSRANINPSGTISKVDPNQSDFYPGYFTNPDGSITYEKWYDGIQNLRYYFWDKGEIRTKQLFKHGVIEIRAKTPQIHGVHPAMWFYTGDSPYDNTKDDHEIDIMEMSQTKCTCDEKTDNSLPCDEIHEEKEIIEPESYTSGRIFQSYHYGPRAKSATSFRCNENFEQSFHTYKCVWNEYVLAYFIDGVNTFSFYHYYSQAVGYNMGGQEIVVNQVIKNKSEADIAIANNALIKVNPYFAIGAMRLQIGLGIDNLNKSIGENLNFGSNNPPTLVPFTCWANLNEEMLVDWVRIYGYKQCTTDLVFNEPERIYTISNSDCTPASSWYNDGNPLPSSIFGKTVTVSGPGSRHIVNNYRMDWTVCDWWGTIYETQDVKIRAIDKITFKPGFSVMRGATLNAKTTTCANGFARYAFAPDSPLPKEYNIIKDYSKDKLVTANQIPSLFNEEEYKKQNPLANIILRSKITIYPNPANLTITLTLTSKENASVTFTDMIGQIVLQAQTNTQSTEFNIAALPKGIYFVTAKTATQQFASKLVKE